MHIAMCSAELKEGDPMDSADFPVVWRATEEVG
jgi:hypothetical protein